MSEMRQNSKTLQRANVFRSRPKADAAPPSVLRRLFSNNRQRRYDRGLRIFPIPKRVTGIEQA
jgi:hypothetical protein